MGQDGLHNASQYKDRAFHEAGHAVAAWLFNRDVLGIAVTPRGGHTNLTSLYVLTIDDCDNVIMMYLAGMVVDSVRRGDDAITGYDWTLHGDDKKEIDSLLEKRKKHSNAGPEAHKSLAELEKCIREKLQENWLVISAIASELCEQTGNELTLDPEQIHAIIAKVEFARRSSHVSL